MQEILLKLISLGALALLFVSFIYIILLIFKIKNPIRKIISLYRIEFLFIFSLMSVVGSLLLSIYFKLAPCELCWYQRVFLFSTPIITGIALLKKHTTAHVYVFWLSIIGIIFSAYHTLLQSKIFTNDTVFCNPNAAVDCSVSAFTYFGFVTVPLIAFSVFLVLILISYESKNI